MAVSALVVPATAVGNVQMLYTFSA